MKKFYLLLTLFVFTAIQIVNAQVPQGIPYQAVARDNAGNLIKNQPISLRFSIHDGVAGGPIVFSETHAITTDALGLFSVNIGGGTSSQTLADVNWGAGAKFTQVELDVTGGNNYVDMGTTQMMSVPYALYAGSSAVAPSVFEPTQDIPDAIHNTNAGNVGIGTDLPSAKLDVAGDIRIRGGLPEQGKVLTAMGIDGAATWQTPVAPDLTGYATTASVNNLADNLAMNYATNSSLNNLADNVSMNYATNSSLNNLADNVTMNYATNSSLNNLADNVTMNYATNSSLNNLADNVTMNYATNSSLNNLADNVAMNYASNNALAVTNTQVQTNTTDIVSLQNQIGNVESNFITTLDDPTSIYNVNPGNVGIGTDLPSEKLDVAGNLKVRLNATISGTITAGQVTYPSAHGTAGQVLGTTGSGTLAWKNSQSTLGVRYIICVKDGIFPSNSSSSQTLNSFLGEIKMVAFSVIPGGWMECNGQSLAIQQYTPLFALIGTTYGGNGTTTFVLPNLNNRIPKGNTLGVVED